LSSPHGAQSHSEQQRDASRRPHRWVVMIRSKGSYLISFYIPLVRS
jgi:hypothetical protein